MTLESLESFVEKLIIGDYQLFLLLTIMWFSGISLFIFHKKSKSNILYLLFSGVFSYIFITYFKKYFYLLLFFGLCIGFIKAIMNPKKNLERVILIMIGIFSGFLLRILTLNYEEFEKLDLSFLLVLFESFCAIIFITILIIKASKNDLKKEIDEEIFDLFKSREIDLENLNEKIKNNYNSILIDDEWGNGKTFFIREFIKRYQYKNGENNNEKYDFIYIKAPYFSDKIEFRKKVVEELSRIFTRNNVINFDLLRFGKYFNVDLKWFSFFLKEPNYDMVIRSIKKDIQKERKIILVLDDVDRIDNKEKLKEIFSFIGELSIDLDEWFSMIVLASREKIDELIEEEVNGERFSDKYFDCCYKLVKMDFDKLLEYKKVNIEFKDFILGLYKKVESIQEEETANNEGRIIGEKTKEAKDQENSEVVRKEKKNLPIRELKSEVKNRINVRNVFILGKKLDELVEKHNKKWTEGLIIFNFIEIFMPTYYKKIKKYNIIENLSLVDPYEFNEKIYYTRYSKNDIIFSFFNIDTFLGVQDNILDNEIESIRKYYISEKTESISEYEKVKEDIFLTSNNVNQIIYEKYKKICFLIENDEDKKRILESIKNNEILSKIQVLNLICKMRISFYKYYNTFLEFHKEIFEKRDITGNMVYWEYFKREIEFIKLNFFESKALDKLEQEFLLYKAGLAYFTHDKKIYTNIKEVIEDENKELLEIISFFEAIDSELGDSFYANNRETNKQLIDEIRNFIESSHGCLSEGLEDGILWKYNESPEMQENIKKILLKLLKEEYAPKNQYYKAMYEYYHKKFKMD